MDLGREEKRRGSTRERVRELGMRRAWHRPRGPEGGGKQEVARGACVRASATCAFSWQRRKATGKKAVVGWAAQRWASTGAGPVCGRQVSLCFFYFNFCFSIFL